MLNDELIKWNQQGLIPGPLENEEDYLSRVNYCLNLKKTIQESDLKEQFSFSESNKIQEILAEARELTVQLFDIDMQWIPLFFSNQKLALWHGGCAWIFQAKEETPTAAVLQLRKAWYDKKSSWGTYTRQELVGHELAHAGRMMFEEPQFEEILAYQTSSSIFRGWFGPIIQSSKEAMAFCLSLFLILLIDLIVVFSGQSELYLSFVWLKLLPAGMVVYGLYRLWKKQKILERCFKKLNDLLKNPKKTKAVIYRLTDSEIRSFAFLTPKEINEYAEAESNQSLRWRLIFHEYFAHCLNIC